jgi:hypothetical protein
MDTVWRSLCLALLMLTSVSLSSPGRAQDSAKGSKSLIGGVYEECDCRLGCVAGEGHRIGYPAESSAVGDTSGLSAEHGLEFEDCSTRMSTLAMSTLALFVEPSIRTLAPRVRDTTLSEKILQYFEEMLGTEFALTISSPDARSQ